MKMTELYGAIIQAEFTLDKFELIPPNTSGNYELAKGIAANLRGTLKNPQASAVSIQSLTSDLEWRISKLSKPSGNDLVSEFLSRQS